MPSLCIWVCQSEWLRVSALWSESEEPFWGGRAQELWTNVQLYEAAPWRCMPVGSIPYTLGSDWHTVSLCAGLWRLDLSVPLFAHSQLCTQILCGCDSLPWKCDWAEGLCSL